METVFANLINGNIADAKRGAKRFSRDNLAGYARDVLGYSLTKSILAAMFLKGEDVWQKYCDAT